MKILDRHLSHFGVLWPILQYGSTVLVKFRRRTGVPHREAENTERPLTGSTWSRAVRRVVGWLCARPMARIPNIRRQVTLAIMSRPWLAAGRVHCDPCPWVGWVGQPMGSRCPRPYRPLASDEPARVWLLDRPQSTTLPERRRDGGPVPATVQASGFCEGLPSPFRRLRHWPNPRGGSGPPGPLSLRSSSLFLPSWLPPPAPPKRSPSSISS